MPLDKFVLILVVVLSAAGATIWLGSMIVVAMQWSIGGLFLLIPALLVGYIAYRVLVERLGNAEDDYYDGIEK